MTLPRAPPPQAILRSPHVRGYRNKSEFTVGFDEARRPTVGLLYGLWREGFTEVGDPAALPHISGLSKRYAALLSDFLRSPASQLPAWDKAPEQLKVRAPLAQRPWPRP